MCVCIYIYIYIHTHTCIYICVCVSCSVVSDSLQTMDYVAHQGALSMKFSRQAIQERVAISYSRGSCPRDRTQVSWIAGRFFTVWATREDHIYVYVYTHTHTHTYIYIYTHTHCAQALSCVWLFVTPWTVAHQASLSMEFSRQEYWRGLPFSPPNRYRYRYRCRYRCRYRYIRLPSGSVVKNSPANAGDLGLMPGWEDPLE